jgi:hypothetical protein
LGKFAGAIEGTEFWHQFLKPIEGFLQIIGQALTDSHVAMPAAAIGNGVRAINSARRVLQTRYFWGSADGLREGAKSLNTGVDANGKPIDRTAVGLEVVDGAIYTAYGVTDIIVWLTEINAFSLGEAAVAVGQANDILFTAAAFFEACVDGWQLKKQVALEAELQQLDAGLVALEANLATAQGRDADAVLVTAGRAELQKVIATVHRDRNLLIINIIKNAVLLTAAITGMTAFRNRYYFGALTAASGLLGAYRLFSDGSLSAVKKRFAEARKVFEAPQIAPAAA